MLRSGSNRGVINKRTRGYFFIFILFVIVVNTMLIIGNYLSFVKVRLIMTNTFRYELVFFVFIVFVSCHIQYIFHELGHFFAGKLLNFKFFELAIFPFVIIKKNERLYLKFKYNDGFMGSCVMCPKTFCEFEERMLFYSSGGLVLSFLLIVIGSLIHIFSIMPNNLSMEKGLILFLVINQINFIRDSIPTEIDGIKSDGAQILSLLRNSESDKKETKLLNIGCKLMAGIRLRDIEFLKCENNSIYNENYSCGLVDIYYYYYYLEVSDYEKAIYYIDFIEKNSRKYYTEFNLNLEYEFLYSYCALKKNIIRAKELYHAIAESLKHNNDNIFCYRIKMAYELYIEGNVNEALHIGKIGLSVIDDFQMKGLAIFEAEQIEKMIKEIECKSNVRAK